MWNNQKQQKSCQYVCWCKRILYEKIHFTHWGGDKVVAISQTIFKCIFLNETVLISLKILLKLLPEIRIDNILALVQMMLSADQATSHYLNQWWLIHWHIYVLLSLNGLKCSFLNMHY